LRPGDLAPIAAVPKEARDGIQRPASLPRRSARKGARVVIGGAPL
jgi:hypothetical protein